MTDELSSYTIRSLPAHLAAAGDVKTLQTILTEFRFLRLKVRHSSIYTLLEDYLLVASIPYPEDIPQGFRLLQEALHLAAHVLAQDPNQLAAQLFGRLMGMENNLITRLLATIEDPPRNGLHFYPFTPSLIPPGGPLHFTLTGHRMVVTSLHYLDRTQQLLTTALDGTVRLWDLVSGTQLPQGITWSEPIIAASLFPDQHRLALVTEADNLVVWAMDTFEQRVLCTFTRQAKAVVVLQDGRHIALGEGIDPFHIRIWDSTSGAEVASLAGHRDTISVLACHAEHGLVSASEDGVLRVWDWRMRTLQLEQKSQSRIRALTVSADAEVVRFGGDGGLYRWEIESNRLVLESADFYTLPFGAVTCSPTGDIYAAGGFDGELFVWNGAPAHHPVTIPGSGNYISALLLTPDQTWLVAGDENGQVKVWDMARLVDSPPPHGHRTRAHLVAIAPDATFGVSTGGLWYDIKSTYRIKCWEFGSNQEEYTIAAHQDAITGFAFSADSRYLVSASRDHTAKIWDLADSTPPLVLNHHAPLNTVVVTPSNLVVTGSGSTYNSHYNALTVSDIQGQFCFELHGHTQSVMDLALLDAGTLLLSAAYDGMVCLWHLGQRVLVKREPSRAGAIRKLSVSPDGCWMVSMGTGSTAELWTLPALQWHTTLTAHTKTLVDIVALSPNRVLTIAEDHTLRLWSIPQGECLFVWHVPTYLTSLRAMPDQRHVLVTGGDGILYLWDTQQYRIVTQFAGESPLLSCAIAADGRRLVVGEVSGRIHLLELVGSIADVEVFPDTKERVATPSP